MSEDAGGGRSCNPFCRHHPRFLALSSPTTMSAPPPSPRVWFNFEQETRFVAGFLGPQLERDHPDTKIFIYDHNMGSTMLVSGVRGGKG